MCEKSLEAGDGILGESIVEHDRRLDRLPSRRRSVLSAHPTTVPIGCSVTSSLMGAP